MSKQQAGSGSSQRDDAPVNLGVGGPTSGEEGSTLTHETMQETGGSGGSQLTGTQAGDAPRGAAQTAGARRQQECEPEPEGAGGDAQAIVRGPQDTRSHQAGGTETGLGTPETGANQRPEDLGPAT
jgi:hypothetical protein